MQSLFITDIAYLKRIKGYILELLLQPKHKSHFFDLLLHIKNKIMIFASSKIEVEKDK